MTEASLKLAILRADSLFNYYQAERRAGADPVLANERMHFFAARLDAEFERQQAAVTEKMERTA